MIKCIRTLNGLHVFAKEAIKLGKDYAAELVLRVREARTFRRKAKMQADPFTDPEAFMQECHKLNTRNFDDLDLARFERTARMVDWPEGISDATMGFANYAQMVYGENPLTGGPIDDLIVFAGARTSTLDRLCHAVVRLTDDKAFLRRNTGKIIVAGSTRVLGEKEKPWVQDFAPEAEIEGHLVNGASNYILNLYPSLPIETVVVDNPKAGTAEVIDAVMEHIGGGEGLRVAGVTTQLYHIQLYLWMAMGQLRHKWANFQTAGHCASPRLVAERNDEVYWNECLSTQRIACMAYHAGC